ncbi:uncharacterized protein EV154DRAFT_551914 [Mucor mucedo]|uniref:uncharacterized protein n=1 Tax=Mucor mucedo TaxID=29922 RepID=UPI00221FE6D6|nr:uncharacterized protein EV154DRAFT_551914 [Mucor mucedo]KAI7890888.1 hypothetical protein EV154DRAFT_551914 [Mucor mucedo]
MRIVLVLVSGFELNGEDYFNAFSDRKRRQRLYGKLGSSEVLKVKDWPQTHNLLGLYDDFMRTAPAPEYCSASGYLNLANRLPEEYLPFDFGPKMFISYVSDNHSKTGKTNLQCDITGQLQEYIRKYKDCDRLHPIFDHAFYMTEQDIERLEAEYGVVP